MTSFGAEVPSLLLSWAVMHPLRFLFLSWVFAKFDSLVSTRPFRKSPCCAKQQESATGEMGNF